MQYKNLKSVSLLKAFACAIFTLVLAAAVHAQDAKVDPTGTWVWSNPGRNGAPGRTNTLVLKAVGDTITGTLTAPARGGKTTDTEISDGKLAGAKLTFNATRKYGTNEVTMAYSGVVSADSIKGTISYERNGEKRSNKWSAKRANGAASGTN